MAASLQLLVLLGFAVVGVNAESIQCMPRCPLTLNTSSLSLPPRVAVVFDPFNAAELESIASHVKSNLSLLENIPEDTIMGDYLYAVDFLADVKSTVLRTIDGGEPYAGRFAKAIVYHLTSEDTARIVEYKVGPILNFPIASTVPVVAMSQLGNYAGTTSLPATMRPTIDTEYSLMDQVISVAMEELSNLTIASYGQTFADGNMLWTDSAPRGFTKYTRQTWIWFMWAREGMFALPLGLSMLIDHKSLDSSKWKVLQLAYNGQGPFNSVDALVSAFNNGSLSIIRNTLPSSSESEPDSDPVWSSMRRRGPYRPLETVRPPVTMNTGGPRYVVSGRQVSWLSWDMHLGYELVAGLRFNDIRFRGERIVFELALQDAYASYSGASPIQSLSQYNDAGWGLGWAGRQLMLGVDCPAHATLLDTHFFVKGKASTARNAICIWEQPDNIALMRHTSQDYYGGTDDYAFVAGVPRTTLVVRTTSTVYNYDYYYNYIFYAEGTIKVEVFASGYLQSESSPSTGSLRRAEARYQTPVRSFTSGNLHDHLFSYKVDLDILGGGKNSLVRSDIKVGKVDLPWNFDGSLKKSKFVQKMVVAKEGRFSVMNSNPSKPVQFKFVKPGMNNKWGQRRGYAFHLGATITQLMDDSIPWMRANQWTKYNIAVTQRKESEQKSGYPLYDMQTPADPVVEFDSYINGESLANKDLVAWIMIGNIHIPSSEDIPVTTTAHTGLSFLIKPVNYFDESPAVDLTTRFHKTSALYPDTPSSNVDTVSVPLSERCFDGTPETTFDQPRGQ